MSETNNSSTILNIVTGLQQERMELVKRVEELRAENECLKITMSTSSTEKDQTDFIETLKSQITSLKEENESLKKNKTTITNEDRAGYERLISQKEERIEDLLKTVTDLKSEMETIQKEYNEHEAQKSLSDSRINELEKLAYTDLKTGALNNNALNKRLSSLDLKRSIFAIFSICGTKHINEKFGKNAGDQFIKKVADQLLSKFNQNVYRIMGDQFVIVFDESEKSYSDAYALLTESQQHLAKIDIKTTFGIARGSEYTSIKLMTDAVEKQLEEFRGTKVTEEVNRWSEVPKPVVKEEKKTLNEISEDELIVGFLR